MEPDQLIADYRARTQATAETAMAVRAEIAAIRGMRTSGDGAVTVTVNVQGGLENLSFGSAANDTSLEALAAAILDTSRKARVDAAKAAAAALEPLVGAGSPAMDELRARIPADDDRPSIAVDDPDTGFTRGG